jgi:cytochrome c peroxidase
VKIISCSQEGKGKDYMKHFLAIIIAICFTLAAVMAMATDQQLLELGEELFHDQNLGGSPNPLSCSSCHDRGRFLENVSINPELMPAIRQCLNKKLGGGNKNRDINMMALRTYVLSISGAAQPEDLPDLLRGFNPPGREKVKGQWSPPDSRGQRPATLPRQ